MPAWTKAAMSKIGSAAKWAGGTSVGSAIMRGATSTPAIRAYAGAAAGGILGGARGMMDDNSPFWGSVWRGMGAGAASGLMRSNTGFAVGLGATALGANAMDIGMGYGAYRAGRAGLRSFMRGFNAPRQLGIPGIAPPPPTGFRGTRYFQGLAAMGNDSKAFIGNSYTRASNAIRGRVNNWRSGQMSFKF